MPRDADPDSDAIDTAGTVLCIRSGPSFALIDDIHRATLEAPDT